MSTILVHMKGKPKPPWVSPLDPEPNQAMQKICTLSTHEHATSQHVLLKEGLFPSDTVEPGSLMRISSIPTDKDDTQHSTKTSLSEPFNTYLFRVRFASSEQLSRMPYLQVSLPQNLATVFRLPRSNPVVISPISECKAAATHVEIAFRDQYLTRGDMWRIINDQLVEQCIYRDQKIHFMGTIKAVIKTIFVEGRKLNSAVFHSTTKPIFRSESARYVLFLQMSKEMWEFDAEGTGEIMFDKIVNGFLPELFKRWKQMQVRHLVTIVLFTRMEYDNVPSNPAKTSQSGQPAANHTNCDNTNDFYRVVASDMASLESASILDRLKREFLVFMRDVSTRKPDIGDYAPLGLGLSAASAVLPDLVIAGQPTAASRGNVLEAINLASSQFSSDYIDRDLVRTGVSVVVVSPGTGVFEVDYNLLVATTENLTDNGVGIDLVCLSRMPLHSVPLFKYQEPKEDTKAACMTASLDGEHTPIRSCSNTMSLGTPSSFDQTASKSPHQGSGKASQWHYGIPHWIDISFWTAVSPDGLSLARGGIEKPRNTLGPSKNKPFRSRVRMYELQMMGVMENAINDISIPLLSKPFQKKSTSSRKFANDGAALLEGPISPASLVGSLKSKSDVSSTARSRASSSQRVDSADDVSFKAYSDPFQWMHQYDDAVFRYPSKLKTQKRRASRISPANKTFRTRDGKILKERLNDRSDVGKFQGKKHSVSFARESPLSNSLVGTLRRLPLHLRYISCHT